MCAREMIPHQPFYLRAMAQTLKILETGKSTSVMASKRDTWHQLAAQAVILKPGNDFRVVHDGAHKVQVNNEVVVEDRLEPPGAREISALQKLGPVVDEKVCLGSLGMVRRPVGGASTILSTGVFLRARHGPTPRVVWLNRTGTFGVASALSWFSRLIGLGGRLAFRVMLESFIFMLVYADDLHLVSGGWERWLHIWTMLALLCVQGTPFSDHKWPGGGLRVDWVGY